MLVSRQPSTNPLSLLQFSPPRSAADLLGATHWPELPRPITPLTRERAHVISNVEGAFDTDQTIAAKPKTPTKKKSRLVSVRPTDSLCLRVRVSHDTNKEKKTSLLSKKKEKKK